MYFKSEKNVLINRHSPSTCQISFAGRKYREIVDLIYKEATVYLKRKKYNWDMYIVYMNYIDGKGKRSDIKTTYKNSYKKSNRVKVDNKTNQRIKLKDYSEEIDLERKRAISDKGKNTKLKRSKEVLQYDK